MANRDEWLALASRAEDATGPDRSLDWDILKALGWSSIGGNVYDANYCAHQIVPNPTGSIDAIVALIERELPGAGITLDKYWLAKPEGAVWDAKLTIGIHGGGGYSEGPSAALALTAAFCRAMAEREQGDA